MNIKELAQYLDASAIENASGSEEITHAMTIEDGGDGAVSFIGNPHYERFLLTTRATAVIVSDYLVLPPEPGLHRPVLIRVKSPYEAFARALELFAPKVHRLAPGIDPRASVDPSAKVDPTARIGANATVGAGAKIGPDCDIHPGAVVGAAVELGAGTVLFPNCVLCEGVKLGRNVVIGPGSVIGFDGFGYVPMADGSYRKIPQVGTVIIEDDVEIGANTTIDRATISETRIRRGAKLDNLIQVAHNVEIGENTVIAAQAGISGSTKIGRQNILAGQVGVVGHIETTEHVIVGAQSGVSKSLHKSGTYFGSPARNHRDALKQEGVIRSLPELAERVKRLEELLLQKERS